MQHITHLLLSEKAFGSIWKVIYHLQGSNYGLLRLFLLVYYSIKFTYGEFCLPMQSIHRLIKALTSLILLSQVRGTPCSVRCPAHSGRSAFFSWSSTQSGKATMPDLFWPCSKKNWKMRGTLWKVHQARLVCWFTSQRSG